MNRVLTVSFDNSSNDDIPTIVIATKNIGIFGNDMEVVNIITGERATQLYDELSKPKKVCVR